MFLSVQVNQYRTHWWRCDGPCVQRPPFFGIVRRAMNRPPAPRDLWWAEHKRKCGGNFVKIKEPEKIDKKKKKAEEDEELKGDSTSSKSGNKNILNDKNSNKSSAITNWFPKSSVSSTTTTTTSSENSRKPKTGSGGSKLRATSSSSTTVVTSKTNQKNKNNSENDIFRSSSENSSSNIYGFKMSANNKSTSQTRDKLASFSGSGQCIGSANSGNQSAIRESFLKKLESNKQTKSTSPTNQERDGKRPLSKDSRNDSLMNIGKTVSRNPSATHSSVEQSRRFGAGGGQSRQPASSLVNAKKRKLGDTIHSNSNENSTSDVISKPDGDESTTGNQVEVNLVECPACPQKVPEHILNEHLDKCLS